MEACCCHRQGGKAHTRSRPQSRTLGTGMRDGLFVPLRRGVRDPRSSNARNRVARIRNRLSTAPEKAVALIFRGAGADTETRNRDCGIYWALTLAETQHAAFPRCSILGT